MKMGKDVIGNENLYRRNSKKKNKNSVCNFSPLIGLVLLLFLVVFALVAWYDATVIFEGIRFRKTIQKPKEFPLKCTPSYPKQTCSKDYPSVHNPINLDSSSYTICPSYFQWIHEDLRPWKETGITRDMIEGARRTAHFRLVILDGKAYIEKYRQSIQTRDMFTLWGILQLLRLYPGRLPDLELMFDCDDRPVIPANDFRGLNATPPPLFRYCSDEQSLDIVFPDWSFWGWPEINIKPWKDILKEISEGNKRSNWKDRIPYAYWKGNPFVDPTRQDLLKCNVSTKNDWNSRLYVQDWYEEGKQGYKQSNLVDQCIHRYKIYIEGWAWSVSEKYILACDAMTLYVKPRFYDFYVRGMLPLKHYWPIRDNSKCTSLKYAVEWGNNHTYEGMTMGKTGSLFMQEDVKMENVYDYMFHSLNLYSNFLRFKPKVPPGAEEICAETLACGAKGTHRKFMMKSMVMFPSDTSPCTLSPSDPSSLKQFTDAKSQAIKQVETWENQYYLHQVKPMY